MFDSIISRSQRFIIKVKHIELSGIKVILMHDLIHQESLLKKIFLVFEASFHTYHLGYLGERVQGNTHTPQSQ